MRGRYRKTKGSALAFLPLRHQLTQGFAKIYKEGEARENPTKITVGARALAKHQPRSSELFWGSIHGTEIQRNEAASKICEKILDEAVWINMHYLSREDPVIEIRVPQGYGARWSTNGTFRGFVEPQMENGHQKKWKH